MCATQVESEPLNHPAFSRKRERRAERPRRSPAPALSRGPRFLLLLASRLFFSLSARGERGGLRGRADARRATSFSCPRNYYNGHSGLLKKKRSTPIYERVLLRCSGFRSVRPRCLLPGVSDRSWRVCERDPFPCISTFLMAECEKNFALRVASVVVGILVNVSETTVLPPLSPIGRSPGDERAEIKRDLAYWPLRLLQMSSNAFGISPFTMCKQLYDPSSVPEAVKRIHFCAQTRNYRLRQGTRLGRKLEPVFISDFEAFSELYAFPQTVSQFMCRNH